MRMELTMSMKSKILTFAVAFALALPAVATMSISEAHAAGDVLDSAGKEGKRTHKRVGKTKSKAKSTSSSKSKRTSNTTRTTTTRRPAGTTRQVGTTTYRSSGTTHRHYTTTRTYVRSHSRPTRTRVVRSTPTHVHHQSDVVYVQDAPPAGHSSASSSNSNVDVYITGGVGTSGFASTTITDDALPGIGWNVAVGGKGKYLGLEIGLDGGGYTFDPEGANTTDLALFGLYGDLKLQPTIAGFFEPYVYAGLGGYVLGDGILDEASSGGAFRLGLGANLRFDDIAIGAKYAWQTMGFTDDSGSYGGDFTGESETLGLNLSIYF